MSMPIEDNDQTRARREHLERIRELVGNVYPNKFLRTNVANSPDGEDTITALVREFKKHVPETTEGARPSAEQLEQANAELNKIEVRASGRLAVPPRVMGKAAFVHLSDGKERLQIYVRRDDVREMPTDNSTTLDGWELFGLLDHGDFIGVEGYLFVTKTGELSIHVRSFQFLAKALLPMPDKLHGISDPEIRQRQRYADLIAGSLKVKTEDDADSDELTPREVFERRSQVIREMRRYLDDHGYIEVETPILSPIASGAAARPFKTHHNALSIDLYARIAPELYLKRLLVGGFERVYELNRNFRNEGIDRTHNPEFTMLEFYCAYMDVNGMMDFWEHMLRTVVQKVTGGTTVRYGDDEIDFGRPFARLTMKEAIENNWPPVLREVGDFTLDEGWSDDTGYVRFLFYFFSLWEANISIPLNSPMSNINALSNDAKNSFKGIIKNMRAEARGALQSTKRELGESKETRKAREIAQLFEMMAESSLIQPTFIYNYPKSISPLSKASPDDPTIAERFELFIAGMECANGFSELNDPVEQYRRFEEQVEQRERGDDEAMQMDTDYVRALAYGMPPAAGIGPGIDRIVMLLTNRRSIRDVILFPHMRPERHGEESDATGDALPQEES